VIKRNKVVCKLGVYEKKTDTMPLIFDLSTFPEGSMRLFEEYDKHPGKVAELAMDEKSTVFDFLIPLFQKMENKQKRLKLAFRNLHTTYEKEKKDKEIKPILNRISAESKKEDPTDAFLYNLQDGVADKKMFVLTMLALQYVFQIEIELKTQDPSLLEIIPRWKIGKVTTVLEVDVDTQEMIQERPYREPVLAKDIPEDVPVDVPGDVPVDVPGDVPGEIPVEMPVDVPGEMPEIPAKPLLEPIRPFELPDPSQEDTVSSLPPKPEKKTRIRKKPTQVPSLGHMGTSLNSVLPSDAANEASDPPPPPKATRVKKEIVLKAEKATTAKASATKASAKASKSKVDAE